MDPGSQRLALIWGLSFSAGALARLLAWLTSLPAVVMLLAIGLLMGRSGLGWIDPEALGQGLEPIVGLLVSLVLFDGGLALRLAGRDRQFTVVRLVGVRWGLGLIGGAAAAHLLAGLSWSLAWVYGAIALATGPTVITPMVRQMRLDPELATVLEAEGLILEPIGAVLALVLLELALGDLTSWQQLLGRLALRLGGGLLAGGLAGLLLVALLRWIGLTPAAPEADSPAHPGAAGGDPQGAVPGPVPSPRVGVAEDEHSADTSTALALQLTLGVLFLLFSGCEALLPEAGLPAAVTAGVVVGLRFRNGIAELDALIRQLAMLAITVLFPLLAADVQWLELSPLGWGGIACVLALMLYRWLVVQLAGLGLQQLDWRDKLILSWIAPRGIVSAAVASLFALQLEQAGIPGAGSFKGLVFLTILLTVSLQGFTAPWLARRLGLVQQSRAD
ncbi:MAG: cation:proton antiporter [Synechococcaceae cyanobacterium]|nr:cation:proton antiporter [Synechococcaceae cyanobacterium]